MFQQDELEFSATILFEQEPSKRMKNVLKGKASWLPARWQNKLKRLYFGRQIRLGRFGTDKMGYAILSEWVAPRDWALDIGANISHYTSRLS